MTLTSSASTRATTELYTGICGNGAIIVLTISPNAHMLNAEQIARLDFNNPRAGDRSLLRTKFVLHYKSTN